MLPHLQGVYAARVAMGSAGVLIRGGSRGSTPCLLPSREVGLKRFPLTVCKRVVIRGGVKSRQQEMLGRSFWFVLQVRDGSLCLLREFDGRKLPLHSQKFRGDFPNFSERFQGCCSLAPDQLQVCEAEP